MIPKLKGGDLLTLNEGEAWYVVVAIDGEAIRVCRIPHGLLPRDYGSKFVHCPTPEDGTAFVLMSANGPRVMQ